MLYLWFRSWNCWFWLAQLPEVLDVAGDLRPEVLELVDDRRDHLEDQEREHRQEEDVGGEDREPPWHVRPHGEVTPSRFTSCRSKATVEPWGPRPGVSHSSSGRRTFRPGVSRPWPPGARTIGRMLRQASETTSEQTPWERCEASRRKAYECSDRPPFVGPDRAQGSRHSLLRRARCSLGRKSKTRALLPTADDPNEGGGSTCKSGTLRSGSPLRPTMFAFGGPRPYSSKGTL